MLLTFVRRIPFFGCPFSFPFNVCRRATTETLSLWFLSSLPIIWSVGAKILSGRSVAETAAEEVNIKAIFVYTSAFLAPVLYLLVERLVYPRKQKIFSGALGVFLLTIAILVFSSWLFQNDKIHDSKSWHVASYSMYAISIYFWWLAIADNLNEDYPYEEEATQNEESFADKAALKRKEPSNE